MAKKRAAGDVPEPSENSQKGPPINIKFKRGLKEALIKYLEDQRPNPGITGQIEVLVEDFLIAKGYWSKADAPANKARDTDY